VANFEQKRGFDMEDLRLLAVEQDFVLLESSAGETFRVALDETLRRAIRQDRSALSLDATLSPREVQDMVRSGLSIEDVVSKSGAPLAYVEKFAAPVIDEIGHILKSALAVRLATLSDRFGGMNPIEFGALISDKLNSLGASNISWSARKLGGGSWQIRCDFEQDASRNLAVWSFDLRKNNLSPENEVALNLASIPEAVAPLIQKMKPVLPFHEESLGSDVNPEPESKLERLVAKNLTSSLGDTQEFAEVIPFGRGRGNTAQVPVIAAGTSAEVEPSSANEEFDDNVDLLENLRRRRDSREQREAFTAPIEIVDSTDLVYEGTTDADFDETTVWIDSTDDVFIETDISAEHDETTDENSSGSPSKKGRASMPSWDEIVFGTRTEDKGDAE
jgi:hypothetical protein